MDTATTDNRKGAVQTRPNTRSVDTLLAVLITVVSFGVVPLHAGEWTVTPVLTTSAVYTDNVELDPPGEEDTELVGEIAPGLSVRGNGRRLNLTADYQFQQLLYLDSSSRNNTNHRLFALGNAELLREHFFLDAGASITRVLVSSEEAAGDAINNVNQTNGQTYTLSPYYTQDFGGRVEALARYRYSITKFDEGASDAVTHEGDVNLRSGRKFTRFTWDMSYFTQNQDRDSGGDFNRQRAVVNAAYATTRRFSLRATGGYVDDDFRTSRDDDNGSYWALGATYRPNPNMEVGGGTGHNYSIALFRWNPTARTALDVTWEDRDVGSNAGQTWNGSFTLRQRRAFWQARYSEDTTTSQTADVSNTVFRFVDPTTGEVVPDPAPGQAVIQVPADELGLTDEVFVQKRGEFSVGLLTGRTALLARTFYEKRDFEVSLDEERRYGGTLSLNWRFGSRTSFLASGGWSRTDFSAADSNDYDEWFAETGFLKRLGSSVDLSVGYQFRKRDSDSSEDDYDENRVTARLVMRF